MLAGPGRWRRAMGATRPTTRHQPVASPDPGAASDPSPAAGTSAPAPDPAAPEPSAPELRARIAHLEQMLQGLQDSVYRESQRVERRLAELEKRAEPGAVAAALSKDARDRGL